jgi:hypothetical protein
MQELDDLGSRALLWVRDPGGTVRIGTWEGSTPSEAAFGLLGLTEPAETLYRLMRLDEISAAEREDWLAGLAGTPRE